MLACLDCLSDGAVHVCFEEAVDVSRIDRKDSKSADRLAVVATRTGEEAIRVCNATGELDEKAFLVAKTVTESFGI